MSKDDEARRRADEDRARQRHEADNDRYRAKEKQKTRDAMEGKGCFPKGTNVTTPNGIRDISLLREGDFVITVNPKNGEKRNCKILKKLTHANHKIWLIEFSDGSFVRTTSIHSFSVNGIWKKASNIRPGDSIFSYTDNEGLRAKVVMSSHLSHAIEDVYNLFVEGDFTFVAEGVLAHSFTYFRNLRILMWSLSGSRMMSRLIAVTNCFENNNVRGRACVKNGLARS